MDRAEGKYYSGQSYGWIHFTVHYLISPETTSISFGDFFIATLPSGLDVKEAELIVRGFIEGYDKSIQHIKKPERALKQIAKAQHERETNDQR